MKKSEIYLIAQACVLRDERIAESRKLEVLRELMKMEDVSKFTEELEEKERVAQAV